MKENKAAFYEELVLNAAGLTQGETHILANLANVSALLGELLPRINWAGFYLLDGGELVLGPFWGKTACLRIQPGKGVCGSALAADAVQRVADVHAFPGHISCDAASRSEIVLPLHAGGRVAAVLDIDSPELDRFEEADEMGLRRLAALLEELDWTHCGYDLH